MQASKRAMSTCEGRLTGGPQGALSAGPLGGGPFTSLSSASRDADALLIRPPCSSLPAKGCAALSQRMPTLKTHKSTGPVHLALLGTNINPC